MIQMKAHGSYWNQRCSKQETWTSYLLNTEDQIVPSAIVIVLQSTSKSKLKIVNKFGETPCVASELETPILDHSFIRPELSSVPSKEK